MILQKLSEARDYIKSQDLKKSGKNKFSDYDYFTPEQINQLVHKAETQAGLIHLFNMKRDENGIHGHLEICEIETGEKIEFVQATDIPIIKATNITQQIGGAVTYTNRYMLMTAFDISDNVLDFDAKDNREQPEPKPAKKQEAKVIVKVPIPEDRFQKMMAQVKEAKEPKEAGNLLGGARKFFTFTNEQESIIKDWEGNRNAK